MHVKGLANKSTFELDISITESHIAKILSSVDSTNLFIIIISTIELHS